MYRYYTLWFWSLGFFWLVLNNDEYFVLVTFGGAAPDFHASNVPLTGETERAVHLFHQWVISARSSPRVSDVETVKEFYNRDIEIIPAGGATSGVLLSHSVQSKTKNIIKCVSIFFLISTSFWKIYVPQGKQRHSSTTFSPMAVWK